MSTVQRRLTTRRTTAALRWTGAAVVAVPAVLLAGATATGALGGVTISGLAWCAVVLALAALVATGSRLGLAGVAVVGAGAVAATLVWSTPLARAAWVLGGLYLLVGVVGLVLTGSAARRG